MDVFVLLTSTKTKTSSGLSLEEVVEHMELLFKLPSRFSMPLLSLVTSTESMLAMILFSNYWYVQSKSELEG